MLSNVNIDRNDAQMNTKAPFTYESPLKLLDSELPSMAFRSIKIYCGQGFETPARLASVSVVAEHPDQCDIRFADASGKYMCHAVVCLLSEGVSDYVTTLLTDDYGVILGHVTYRRDTPGALLTAARRSDGLFTTQPGDFTLLPQCHEAWITGNCKAVSVNGDVTRSNVRLIPSILVHTRFDNGGAYCFDLADVYWPGVTVSAREAINGICNLVVHNVTKLNGVTVNGTTDPIWVGGKHLVIRSSITSNIRVSVTGSSILLKGVMDG